MKLTYLMPVLVLASWLGGQGPVQAQASIKKFDKVVKYHASIEPATAKRGETVLWKFTVELAEGWHTYPVQALPTDAKDLQQYTQIDLASSQAAVFVGALSEPQTVTKTEKGGVTLRELEGKFVWERPLVVTSKAPVGTLEVNVPVTLVVCTTSCLPPETRTVSAQVTVSDAPPVPIDPKYELDVERATNPLFRELAEIRKRLDQVSSGSKPSSAPSAPSAKSAGEITADTPQEYKASLEKLLPELQRGAVAATDGRGDLAAFVLAGVFWGFVSLITPCVFPMIPITVSFFLKQSEKEHHRPLAMALVYSGTIVVVLTIAAVLLLSFFRLLSVSPIMNFALGALFIFFALSLFGMYEIELPSSLANFTSSQQGRGGLLGTMFMALTFTIISFACVAPFLGGFGGTAATMQFSFLERILGGLAFSITFASPFFLLALFPALLKRLPKSGSWLNSVKVVMGFLELAAAIKFFRSGELVYIPKPVFFTYDLTLGMYIAICLLCGLYLLNVYRLPHDSPLESIGVPRLLFGFAFLALGFYLVPGLFKHSEGGTAQRPNGTVYAWIDSFLLPEPEPAVDKAWTGNLPQAIAEVRALQQKTGERKFIFIDFTGETCTNCKINERSVFPKPEIQKLFQQYTLVKMYTDKVPDDLYAGSLRSRFGSSTERQQADAHANLWFQKAAFNTEQLPLYVILEPLPNDKVEVVGIYQEGKINDESAFAQFLQKPLAGNSARAQAGN